MPAVVDDHAELDACRLARSAQRLRLELVYKLRLRLGPHQRLAGKKLLGEVPAVDLGAREVVGPPGTRGPTSVVRADRGARGLAEGATPTLRSTGHGARRPRARAPPTRGWVRAPRRRNEGSCGAPYSYPCPVRTRARPRAHIHSERAVRGPRPAHGAHADRIERLAGAVRPNGARCRLAIRQYAKHEHGDQPTAREQRS